MMRQSQLFCVIALVVLLSGSGYGLPVTVYPAFGGADATATEAFWTNSGVSWQVLDSSDEADNGVAEEADFVGDINDPGLYWDERNGYIFFRFRVDIDSVTLAQANGFNEAHHVLIDVVDYEYGTGFGSDNVNVPDYSFAWDSGSQPTNHGLEMLHIGGTFTNADIWKDISMDDVDGTNGSKLEDDINGNGRTTDGYLEVTSGVSTTAFVDTTFVDFAVSWNYLKTHTDLAPGQTWKIALASNSGGTDHSVLSTDIGLGASPTDATSSGWSSTITTTPEPTTFSLVMLAGLCALSRRFSRRIAG